MKSGEYDPTVGAADTEAEVGRGEPRSAMGELEGYELKEVIGKGGMGEVVLARDTRMERDVALKRMLSQHPSAEAEARFLREAKIQAALDHPSIVPVHELGRDSEGRPYFVMKRLVGTTLQTRIDAGGPLQPLLRALVDVCQAIDRAHTYGIVHRDLKPSNIMLGDYGEVYVLDWGIARVINDRASVVDLAAAASPSQNEGTRTGQMLGTPGYMAPEQMLGQDGVGPAADVYALGSILFEILVGKPLHPRGHDAIPSTMGNSAILPSTRALDRDIPPELDRVCKVTLETDPAARPTARELAARIQEYLDGDRDVERRKELAAEELAIARRAFAEDDRARTMRHAGRAMTLDVECVDAIDLATRLVLEPPAKVPAEVEARLAQEEVRQSRERSGRAIPPFLSFFAFLLTTPWIGVQSWSSLLFVALAIAGQVVVAYINWNVRPVPISIYALYQLLVVFAFSRIAGPFLMTPVLVTGILLSFTAVPWVNDRPGFVALWSGLTLTVPLLAEHLGWISRTWHLTGEGLLSYGAIFPHGGFADVAATIVGNVALVVVVGLYARGIARDRRIAQRRVLSTQWHLEQLIPKPGTRSSMPA